MVIPMRTTTMIKYCRIWRSSCLSASWWLRGVLVDVRGNDLMLTPFGIGRRVCPGKNLEINIIALWIGRLVHHFEWSLASNAPKDLS